MASMLLPSVPELNESASERELRLSLLRDKGHPHYLQEGKRVYTDTSGLGFKQGWLSWLLAISTLTSVGCWFHILFALAIFSWIPWVRSIILVLAATVFMPAGSWDRFKYGAIMSSWRQYFNYSIIVDHVLRQNDERGHLFCWFPHGVLAFGYMALASTDKYFYPDREISGTVGSSVLYIPLFRHISTWLGGFPATRKTISRLLSKGRSAVHLSVGGMAEMFLTSRRDVEQVYLKNRKGFIRLAVTGGHTLAPMYYFGQSHMLTLWSPKMFSQISRRLGFSIGFLFGRFGLPIPRQVDCMVVSGAPIDCGPPLGREHKEFEARVEKVHVQFMVALKKLFDDHKKEYGWEDKELVIL